MGLLQVEREIAALRDPLRSAADRALAAASLAQSASTSADAESAGAAVEPPPVDPAQRMFGYHVRHPQAVPWDGRGMRSGTITYVDDERIEQYVGQQTWIVYEPAALPAFSPAVGDQIRISRRGAAPIVEAIGQNRLQIDDSVNIREIRSGMFVFRSSPIDGAEIASIAQSLAERYAGKLRVESDGIGIEFRAAAQLRLTPAALDSAWAAGAAGLLLDPLEGAVRLDVVVRTNRAEAALDAERSLALCAAMFASDADAVAIDDTGAILSSDELHRLGVGNEMRADAFGFVAAAAQRLWPCPQMRLVEHQGVCDELILFSSRPWRAEFAASHLRRSLDVLSQGAQLSGDPIVPTEMTLDCDVEQGRPGTLARIALLTFETVELEVAFLDATCAHDDVRRSIEARKAVEVLLGHPIASAIVFAFGNRGDDTESALFVLEMRRADALATALAAAYARRDAGVAADAIGALFSADELIELALRRSGKAASWNARVAALALDRQDHLEAQLDSDAIDIYDEVDST